MNEKVKRVEKMTQVFSAKGYVIVEEAYNPKIAIDQPDGMDIRLGRIFSAGGSKNDMPVFPVGSFILFNANVSTILTTNLSTPAETEFYIVHNSGVLCSVYLDSIDFEIDEDRYNSIVDECKKENLSDYDANWVAHTMCRQKSYYMDGETMCIGCLIHKAESRHNV